MAVITVERLSEHVGVEILGVDVERLRADDDLPGACTAALEEYGVLLFRELHADDESQVEFCRKLGSLAKSAKYRIPEVTEISFDPANPNAEYFRSNDRWHLDGCLDAVPPPKAGVLSAHVVAAQGGETEFASTYNAYEALSSAEKERFAKLRVVHTFEAVQRHSYPDPTPEQLAEWASRPERTHPLVWEQRSGRRSLVIGSTTSHVVGLEAAEGRELLDELEQRTTTPDRVLRHTWTVGDMVIWDNRGLVHRACEFDRSKPRVMHRTTLLGDEPIQ
ncbi:taurine catabolism dioxygenase TauD [Parafrankia colletiae]|uniref:Taurine catabolism dioxygenase TauD n=1 Tax=Parafrankia colletiae TaxID=573497 RepID=A0A1S1QKT6_9ACTN|nr:TauD/TfdA family dioxygenase [Parafrankia colletiae]MCK9900888.1 TauD/TfdA family dioxygenase [Frankia sp. Cpl3]OHV34600.1 taurine catabolism dioxygenase TauD [Parafrankia colletiae]